MSAEEVLTESDVNQMLSTYFQTNAQMSLDWLKGGQSKEYVLENSSEMLLSAVPLISRPSTTLLQTNCEALPPTDEVSRKSSQHEHSRWDIIAKHFVQQRL
ncbi:hypothetical protein AB6A40_002790 [Gnathostoma spinigerum]|uniref:Uncharacterized protein n=1 Tax=Gnathostoma spinigerum TaxID=75299 RepID=A0ABD6EA53_9BILA